MLQDNVFAFLDVEVGKNLSLFCLFLLLGTVARSATKKTTSCDF